MAKNISILLLGKPFPYPHGHFHYGTVRAVGSLGVMECIILLLARCRVETNNDI